jgi:LysR family glycine cleavage system transcriptional activator
MTSRPPERPEPLPSLNALLAFEAAARLSSFTHAARELGVTQTAISHQVRALEENLDTALFRRTSRGIILTDDGQRWAAELGVVFARLRDANTRLRRPRVVSRPAVSISIVPSFGARWLVPRLGRFLASRPEVDVRISATERLVDLATEPVDIAIRYGLGSYPGLSTTKLLDDTWIVVAAPSVAAKHAPWRLSDLNQETLLSDDHRDAWSRWFRARSRALPEGVRRSEISDSSMLVEATVRGQGVGLARRSLAVDELGAGRLVLLFPKFPALPTGLGYYLVSPRTSLRRKPVADFRDWVLSEAESLHLPGQ